MSFGGTPASRRFVTASPGDAYYEFNFAPSTQWAAYRFSGYRSGMRVAMRGGAPLIEVQRERGALQLQASLDLDRLPDLPKRCGYGVSASRR